MNSMQPHHLTVSKSARYFMLGSPDSQLQQVWFVCHGYGQLASLFIKHFEILNDEPRLIIAPEGLSRFYWEGFSGRVGASWMTKEDRLNEIEDYVSYLDTLYNEVFKQVNRDTVKVFVLGFSQGVATVCRWLSQGRAKADQLILWAGTMPPELDAGVMRNMFQQRHLTLVLGKQDEIADPVRLIAEEKRLKEREIPYRLILFEGGHQIDSEVLKELANS